MFSEFLFEFLDRVGPVDRFGSLVVIRDVLAERAFESTGAEKVIGLQVFALQHTEPDFELIEPGGIGRQPEHLKVQLLVTGTFLLTEPAFQLFGGVRGAVVLSISNRQASKQMACATTMIARFVQQRHAWACWTRRLFSLACLDGGL